MMPSPISQIPWAFFWLDKNIFSMHVHLALVHLLHEPIFNEPLLLCWLFATQSPRARSSSEELILFWGINSSTPKTIQPRHSAAPGIRFDKTLDKLGHQPAFLDNFGVDNLVESHVSAITKKKGPEIPPRHYAICSDEMQRKIQFLNFYSPTIWIASESTAYELEKGKKLKRITLRISVLPNARCPLMLEDKGWLIFQIPFLTQRFWHALLMKNKRIDS